MSGSVKPLLNIHFLKVGPPCVLAGYLHLLALIPHPPELSSELTTNHLALPRPIIVSKSYPSPYRTVCFPQFIHAAHLHLVQVL